MHAMSTITHDDPATALVLEHLSGTRPGARPLIVGDMDGALAAALAGATDCAPVTWTRYAGETVPATPWPAPGPYTAAYVRLPKGRDAQAFAIGAAAVVLQPSA